ncbi:putative Glutaminyl cyclase [Taphrina deformans PYCC 5710]|uniref:Peptide hydrolase n=1 Tax=Taphrina deformans (strain PYCC 5710 / ATCC 11124 / CBS 356.35 / IMI 108563 / JCM 9778 / NBRC 8474) TaxID=1097556 RepID=R4XB31_TAPDE|nr:putative Glutaminyl cyclase [Taphrina deformans PYCC 5710]|eukprot:CCG82800.1 putative Glutaminyl cyclase [Taphrina deformans PYCC 5710]
MIRIFSVLILALQVLLRTGAFTTYSKDHFHAFAGSLPSLSSLDKDTGSLLTPLLVPRVSGTQGATDVFNWLHTYLSRNLTGWKVEEDRFTAQTPLAQVEFVNLVATMDPPGVPEHEVTRLVLAAHYDSKMFPPGFIGATDSSVPCAILLYIAEMLSARLPFLWEEEYWDDLDGLEEKSPLGVQLIFFDGEEAVHDWTHEDSIYGAKHLAERWESELVGPLPTSAKRNKLQTIGLFVLLDLLGAPNTLISSFFTTTHWAYSHLAWIEELLRETKLAKSTQSDHIFAAGRTDFNAAGLIEDDHLPFMQRGVEILHLIPVPFPAVWHAMEDDGEHLDQASIDDLAVIFSVFTAQWLDMPTSAKQKRSDALPSQTHEEL